VSSCLFLKCLLHYSTKNTYAAVALYTTDAGIVFLWAQSLFVDFAMWRFEGKQLWLIHTVHLLDKYNKILQNTRYINEYNLLSETSRYSHMQTVPYYSPSNYMLYWTAMSLTGDLWNLYHKQPMDYLYCSYYGYEGIWTVLLLLVFCRIHYKMYMWYNYFMSILHLHHDKLYILAVRVLILYGLTECIINEWLLKLTNVTTFVYSCCSNNNFIWSNKPVMFCTPLFVREKSHSTCQRQPQHYQQDSPTYKHKTLTRDTLVVTDPVVTDHRYSLIITDELDQSSLGLEINDISITI
jgi:hypothetical protein